MLHFVNSKEAPKNVSRINAIYFRVAVDLSCVAAMVLGKAFSGTLLTAKPGLPVYYLFIAGRGYKCIYLLNVQSY